MTTLAAPKTKKLMTQEAKLYWVYLLDCKGSKYYCGIALDVQSRFEKHCAGKGAAYTRANPPLSILASMRFTSKGDALRAEHAIKKLPKAKKLSFFTDP